MGAVRTNSVRCFCYGLLCFILCLRPGVSFDAHKLPLGIQDTGFHHFCF